MTDGGFLLCGECRNSRLRFTECVLRDNLLFRNHYEKVAASVLPFDDNDPALHHETNLSRSADLLRRISGDGHKVGE